jgi:hypothetical protein
MTEAQVDEMHGRELHPQCAADRCWRYSPSEVSTLAFGGTADGAAAARVFAVFKKGVPLQDVVIETQQTPARVNALREEYDRMAGGLVLSPEVTAAVRKMFDADALSEEALLAAVKAHSEARFHAGFLEGREDALDYGEVINPKTGERRKIARDDGGGRPSPVDPTTRKP